MDPEPGAEWEIWYQDTFDRDCPRQVELAGRGLVSGLIELWARHFLETVQPDGRQGFSRFNLWWKQRARSLEVRGEGVGQARLREWALSGRQGPTQAGDADLLGAIATAHARLALAGRTGEAIVAAAATAAHRQAFEAELVRLATDAGEGRCA